MEIPLTGLKENTYTSFILPPQAVPTKKKNKAWGKDCMDALENIGLRQLSRVRDKFDRAYRITEGDFTYSDMSDSTLFLSEIDYWRDQADLRDNIEHYGFIEPLVTQLIGEFLKKPDPIVVDSDDDLSTNEYTRSKTDLLWNYVRERMDEEINRKLMSKGIDPNAQMPSPEEQEQYQQQVQQEKQAMTPREIERYMNQDWKPVYVEWAEETLKEDRKRFDLDELDRDCMYDYLVTGRCFRHYRIGYDYYRPERWDPRETFTSATSRTRYPERGDYIGRIKYYTPNEVITHYGHILNEKEKQNIVNATYFEGEVGYTGRERRQATAREMIEKGGGYLAYTPFPSYVPYSNAKYLQDITGIDLGLSDMFPNGSQFGEAYLPDEEEDFRVDLFRVVEGYWVSQQKIGYLTYLDEETGIPITEILTDEILDDYLKENKIKQLKTVTLEQHEKNPQANTIVWDYQPITYYGVKICKLWDRLDEDMYLGMKPTNFQLKGDSETYQSYLPVTGIVDKVSFVSKLYQYQIDHNIAMNMARDYMSKELGVFYLMDFSYLPAWLKDEGGEESLSKLYDIIRELGFLPIDGESQNTRSNFNQFQAVNMDLTQAMLQKVQYAQLLKQLAFENVGMTPERYGSPTEQQTATGVKQSLYASFAKTEVLYDKFAKHQKNDAEIHLNIAKVAKYNDVDKTINYVDSDKQRTFIRMHDPHLPVRRFRIIPQNNSKRRSELEVIKQFYLNDNTIDKDLESIASVVSSDSVSKIIQLGRIGREIAQLEQQKQMMHQQQMQQQQLQAEAIEKEREREFEAKENELDRQLQLRKQAILALGFTKEGGQRDSVIEELRYSLDKLKVETDIENRNLEREDERLQKEKENNLEQQKIGVDREKVAAEKYKADKQLEIARENKTQYELNQRNKRKNQEK